MNNLNNSNLSGLNNAYLDNLIVVNNCDAYKDLSGSTLFGIPNYYYTHLKAPIQEQIDNLGSISGPIYSNFITINNTQNLYNSSLSGLIYDNYNSQNLINVSLSSIIYSNYNELLSIQPTFSIGTTTSLPSTYIPTISLTQLGYNYAFNFGLVQGIQGAIGPTGGKGDKGDTGKTGSNGITGGGGSGILEAILSIIISVVASLITEALLTALGGTTLTALQAQIAYLDHLTLELRFQLTNTQLMVIEAQANIATLTAQVENAMILIEQLNEKVVYITSAPETTNLFSNINIYSPLQSNIYGDLKVANNITVDNGIYVRDLLTPTGYRRLDTSIINII